MGNFRKILCILCNSLGKISNLSNLAIDPLKFSSKIVTKIARRHNSEVLFYVPIKMNSRLLSEDLSNSKQDFSCPQFCINMLIGIPRKKTYVFFYRQAARKNWGQLSCPESREGSIVKTGDRSQFLFLNE